MQQRPYPEDDGQRVWLSRQDQQRLLDHFADDQPRRRLAVQLGLHGLRTDEVVSVAPGDFRTLDGGDQVLIVRDGKTGKREVPVADSLPQWAGMMKSAARLTQDDFLVDVAKRTVRGGIQNAREDLADDCDDDRWLALGMHDLRRTFVTDTYYSLAFAGIPIAEKQ